MKITSGVLALLLAVSVSQGAPPAGGGEQAIRTLYSQYSKAVAAKDVDGLMAFYAPDVVAFDAFPPREYIGSAAYRKDFEGFFAAYPGPVQSTISDLTVKVAGPVAYSFGVDRWIVTDAQNKTTAMTLRFTDVLTMKSGKWHIVHEHNSFPVDPTTGAADFESKP